MPLQCFRKAPGNQGRRSQGLLLVIPRSLSTEDVFPKDPERPRDGNCNSFQSEIALLYREKMQRVLLDEDELCEHTSLAHAGAQGSTALKAALTCFTPELQLRSKYWGMRLQRRNPGLTLLPQPFSDLLSALGTAGEITALIISSLEIPSERARACASMLLATHFAQGSCMAMLNWACITSWKRIICAFSLTFCLFLVKRESYFCFITLFCPAFLPTSLTLESGIWI